jgi:hypothetical protein
MGDDGHTKTAESKMRHAQSETLLAYWRARRLGGAAPHRADIEPADIAGLLGHIFILRRVDPHHHTFRLAGTEFCQMFQREFRDQNFLSLWRGHDVTHVQSVLESTLAGVSPASVVARAYTLDLHQIPVEISFLPLRGPEGMVDRVMGLFQPLDDVAQLRGQPLIRMGLKEIRPPAIPGHLFPSALQGAAEKKFRLANDR